MATGSDIRAKIDSEHVKGLVLINGGGVTALLLFLPAVLDKDGYKPLVWAVLAGLFFFVVGLTCAVVHNHFRRICSLHYEENRPRKKFLWYRPEPIICQWSKSFMWVSVLAFVLGALGVVAGGACAFYPKRAPIEKAKDVQVMATNPTANDGREGIQPLLVAMVAGGFSLVGGAAGAWFSNRTDKANWLRQQQSEVFSKFLNLLASARSEASAALFDMHLEPSLRDIRVTEAYLRPETYVSVVRFYLPEQYREEFMTLFREARTLHSLVSLGDGRLLKMEKKLTRMQEILESVIGS